jgi:hypothetical protein
LSSLLPPMTMSSSAPPSIVSMPPLVRFVVSMRMIVTPSTPKFTVASSPISTSLLASPVMVSLPRPPISRSTAAPPSKVSSPLVPGSVMLTSRVRPSLPAIGT